MKKYYFIILMFTLLVTPFFCSASENIFYMSQAKEKEGIESLKNNADKIDVLAPQFYGVSPSMKLTGKLDNDLKEAITQAQAQNNKLKVMPLISNAGFQQSVIHNLLISQKSQADLISALVVVAKKEKYIGWQFDFENISYLDKDLYSAFVESTAKSLHQNNLILSVAVVTRFVDYENTDAFKNWAGAYDYARLSRATDFISLMTYDDPNSVGPVASLPFINKVLAYVKDKIPPSKISLGIPLYYWGWTANPFEKIVTAGSYDKLAKIMGSYQHNSGFSAALGSSWMTYVWQNQQYQLWYQDKASFQSKLDLIKQNNFRGFSAWVLGIEDPGIWSALSH